MIGKDNIDKHNSMWECFRTTPMRLKCSFIKITDKAEAANVASALDFWR